MKKEYEIIDELGPRNWLDVVAGEAVLLGHMIKDSILVTRGTELAGRVKGTSYSSDEFGEVIGLGKSLLESVKGVREKMKSMEYFDAIFVGSEKNKDCFEWEYDFIFADGKYRIELMLPEYYDRLKLVESKKIEVEMAIREVFVNPRFEEMRMVEWSFVCNDQDFVNRCVCDDKGEEIYKSVDFCHEESAKRGRNEFYYFTDFDLALRAWQGVKEVFTSSQTR